MNKKYKLYKPKIKNALDKIITINVQFIKKNTLYIISCKICINTVRESIH